MEIWMEGENAQCVPHGLPGGHAPGVHFKLMLS